MPRPCPVRAGPGPLPPPDYTPRQVHAVFWGLVPVMLLGAIDQAIVAPALVPIATEFRDFNALAWVMTAYLLASTASMPLAGRLSDLHGRRCTVLAALALLLAGSMVCGWASRLDVLLLGRGIQGLGGGALLALPNAIVADILSPRERGRYQAYISCTNAVAGLAGPLAGALLAGHASWRWIFWLHLPLIALAAVLVWRSLGGLPSATAGRRLDTLGAALLFGATSCLVLALSRLGRSAGWTEASTLALLAGGALFTAAFLGWQQRTPHPLLPPTILRNPVIAVTSAGAVLVAMVQVALVIHAPLHLQWIHGWRIGGAGSALAAALSGVVLGAYLSGQYMRHTGRYKAPPLAGLALAALAAGVLAGCHARAPAAAALALMFLLGSGIGLSQPPMTLSSQNAVPPSDIGIATAVQMFSRAVGGSLGIVAFGALVPDAIGTAARSPGTCDAACVEQGFGMLFAAFAATLGLAWLALTRLRAIPLREHAAGSERRATPPVPRHGARPPAETSAPPP